MKRKYSRRISLIREAHRGRASNRRWISTGVTKSKKLKGRKRNTSYIFKRNR